MKVYQQNNFNLTFSLDFLLENSSWGFVHVEEFIDSLLLLLRKIERDYSAKIIPDQDSSRWAQVRAQRERETEN